MIHELRWKVLPTATLVELPGGSLVEWLLAGLMAVLALFFLVYGAGGRRPWGLAFVLALTAIAATSTLAPRHAEPGSLQDPTAQGRPVKAEELGYVSSETCRSCHPREYATWHRSFHRTMTQVVGPDTVLSDWDTTLTIRGRDYHLYRVGEEFWVDMVDPQFGERGRDLYGDFMRSENETERVQKRAVLATGSPPPTGLLVQRGRRAHPLSLSLHVARRREALDSLRGQLSSPALSSRDHRGVE